MESLTKAQASLLLKLNQQTYPAFYKNFKAEDAEMLRELWMNLFSDTFGELVVYVFRQALRECEYPVTPAEVQKRIKALKSLSEPNETELWSKFYKAVAEISRLDPYGPYDYDKERLNKAKEVYDLLPEQVKGYCGLREMAVYAEMSDDELISYVRPQFMKRMPEVKERQRLCAGTPPQILEFLNGNGLKRLGVKI